MSAFHHSPAPFCNSLPCTGAFSTYFYNYMHKGAPMAKLKTKKPCESVKFASLLTGNYVELRAETMPTPDFFAFSIASSIAK